jgi:hypothetical protein
MSNVTACGSKNPIIDYVNEFRKISQVSHILSAQEKKCQILHAHPTMASS